MEPHSERPDQGSVDAPQESNQPPTGGGEASDMGHPRRKPLSIGGQANTAHNGLTKARSRG
eukprot:4565314-Alexandrium_andersonii.AAC.1